MEALYLQARHRVICFLNKYVYLSAALVLAFRYHFFDRFRLLVNAAP
jgi:hypothetical protein